MKHVFTSDDCKKVNMMKNEKSDTIAPRKQTLAFIMQFAKSYHVEKNLPLNLSGIILN